LMLCGLMWVTKGKKRASEEEFRGSFWRGIALDIDTSLEWGELSERMRRRLQWQ